VFATTYLDSLRKDQGVGDRDSEKTGTIWEKTLPTARERNDFLGDWSESETWLGKCFLGTAGPTHSKRRRTEQKMLLNLQVGKKEDFCKSRKVGEVTLNHRQE